MLTGRRSPPGREGKESAMADIVNLIELEPGQRVRLRDGAVVDVVSNPRDGVWLFVRYPAHPDEPAPEGAEDMVFAQDVTELLPEGDDADL